MACGVVLGLAAASGATTALAADGPTVQERLGHPASARLLILHADDLGMSRSVNRATFEALEKGWITSASVLVPCPWFPDVARWAKAHPEADLGIHLALNSEWTGYRWPSLTGAASLSDPDGYMPLLETAVVANARPADIEAELRAQIARARAAGLRISHVDSHMATLFRTPELFALYRKVGTEAGVPFLIERIGERGGAASAWAVGPQEDALVDRVVSINPGPTAAEWQSAYEKMLAPLPPGVYQLILHLAYDDEEMRGATYDHPNWGSAWRQQDLDLVKSPTFRDFLKKQGFVLVTWADLAKVK
jgi:chitin disaccharide deacetylase